MKATKIKYEKTFNLGNYSNEVIGIEIELEEGEKAADAIKEARKYVHHVQEASQTMEKLQKVVDNPDNIRYGEVQEAKEKLEKLNEYNNDLPF